MATLRSETCPRCDGPLSEVVDIYGADQYCWYCGYAGPVKELDPIPLAEDLSDPTSAVAIVNDFAAHFLPTEMSQEMLDEMTEVLLDGVPVWEWYNIYTQDEEAARNRLRGLLSFMTNLPEYQLT